MNPFRKFQKRIFKAAFFTGLTLAVGICGALIFFSLTPGREFFTGGSNRDVFHRLLREYDTSLAIAEPASLNRSLNRLEKNTQGVESWLSVLKRRRNLAREAPGFLGQYRDAAIRAAAAFPYSEPLAALAAGALLLNSPVTDETIRALKNYASLIAEPRFAPLALGIHILSGDMENSGSAAASNLEPFLAAGLPLLRGNLPADEEDRLIANLGILRLLRGDIPGAAVQVPAISAVNSTSGAGTRSPALLHFIAEYYYDFGDPLRAAELFSRFNDEASMSRSADALWIGDRAASARNIWKILVTPPDLSPNVQTPAAVPAIRIRSLYNLAATAADQQEAAAWLERLFAEGRAHPVLQTDPCFYAGLIRYTRLLDTNRALAILGEEELQKQPLLDLELLRRRGELWPADRTVAETWLLLGRHPEEAALYQWGAYFFDRHRKYDESALLLKTAERHQIKGPWLDLNAGIRLMEEGRLEEAEEVLRAIPRSSGIWQANANLARLLEARHAPAAALEHYETAASLVTNPESASLIQFRIALCLQNLGRIGESRRVLEYALDLNPDNLKARMELRKISSN
ncbi:hypothetical protein AGMMS49587_14570 [Spirochaetia bacterium]|nr:hypothetical protein AGMMS49587_14570 [Spirochaetia bacterium]